MRIYDNMPTQSAQVLKSNPDAEWLALGGYVAALVRLGELDQWIARLDRDEKQFGRDPRLVHVAVNLGCKAVAAGLRSWSAWPALPDEEQLSDDTWQDTWVAEQVAKAQERAKQAEEDRRWANRIARQRRKAGLGTGTGKGVPIHLQRSKYTLDQLADRLEATIAKHMSERGEFKVAWLDPGRRNHRFIPSTDGGLTNKHLTHLAGMIAGRARRTPEEELDIATAWLRQRAENR
jgi:hypothetical protein